MVVYTVTLGVTCDRCHSTTDWKNADKPPMKMVKLMTALFDEPKCKGPERLHQPYTSGTNVWSVIGGRL